MLGSGFATKSYSTAAQSHSVWPVGSASSPSSSSSSRISSSFGGGGGGGGGDDGVVVRGADEPAVAVVVAVVVVVVVAVAVDVAGGVVSAGGAAGAVVVADAGVAVCDVDSVNNVSWLLLLLLMLLLQPLLHGEESRPPSLATTVTEPSPQRDVSTAGIVLSRRLAPTKTNLSSWATPEATK